MWNPFDCPNRCPNSVPTIGRLSTKSAPVPKVEFREEVANVALPELLEQRGLSEGRYVANVVVGRGQASSKASSPQCLKRMGGNSRNLTSFSLPFAGTTKLYGCTTRPCLKCYPSRMPLKSATTSTTRANPAKGCNNMPCGWRNNNSPATPLISKVFTPDGVFA